jgi:hypothetical protein
MAASAIELSGFAVRASWENRKSLVYGAGKVQPSSVIPKLHPAIGYCGSGRSAKKPIEAAFA